MKLKISYINRGILLNDFKRFSWISAAYLLGLLLSVPLTILMQHSQLQRAGNSSMITPYQNIYLQVLQFNSSPLQILLLILVPILTGLWLFQYLQDGKAADMVHALPVKRETLYNTHILAGLIFLLTPLLITALVSWAVIAGLGITQVGGLNVLVWFAFALLFNLLFFMTSVATAMFTGMSTVQAVLSLILLLLPSGLSMLLLYNLRMFAYGFAFSHYYNGARYSPLLRISELTAIHSGEIVTYLLICVFLYLVGRYLYRRRQLETAGDAITFGALRPVFKYGATFCFMMLAGSYFFSTQKSMAWTYFGYIIGSLAAYFLIEILFSKSLHVFHWKSARGYGVFGLIMVLLIAWLHFGLCGFEQRLPELSQVDSVYLATFFAHPQITNASVAVQAQPVSSAGMTPTRAAEQYLPLETPLPVFKDARSIADIYALHQKLIINRAVEMSAAKGRGLAGPDITPLCLVYKLKNGAHIYRQYYVELSDYAPQLKPLYESGEYKYLYNGILEVNPADITMIDIEADQINKSVRLVDPRLIQQAFTALQSDVGKETYEEMTSGQPGWASINIILSNKKTTNLEWKKSYANFDQWLQGIGELQNARLTRDDINYAMVLKRSAVESLNDPGALQQYLVMENSPDRLKVTDPEQLETCLRQFTYPAQPDAHPNQQPYQVIFNLKSGSLFMAGFTEADAPTFVKEHFAGRQSGS